MTVGAMVRACRLGYREMPRPAEAFLRIVPLDNKCVQFRCDLAPLDGVPTDQHGRRNEEHACWWEDDEEESADDPS